MGEAKQEVKTKIVNYTCDECGIGFMQLFGTPKTFTIKYKHKCDNCGAKARFIRVYPYLMYEDSNGKTVGCLKNG